VQKAQVRERLRQELSDYKRWEIHDFKNQKDWEVPAHRLYELISIVD